MKRLTSLLIPLTALSVACSDAGSDPAPDVGPGDSGQIVDTGNDPADGGNPSDTGTADTGSNDTGVIAMDAGMEDSGPPEDAGGPNGDRTCDPAFGVATACGGNLVGSWTYESACTDDDSVFTMVQAICPGVTSNNQFATTSGMLEIRANMTFTRAVDTTVTTEMTVPAACAAVAGGCAGFASAINVNTPLTATCADLGAACDCTVQNEVGTFDNGNYILSGNTVIAEGLEYYYCVDQDVLKYRGTENNNADNELSFVLIK